MLFPQIVIASLTATVSFAKLLYVGINMSSGEFGVYGNANGIPGTFGKDYAFITKSSIDTFINTHKINLFRVAFLLERMCPPSTGLGAKFDETHFKNFNDAVTYITGKGAYAHFDPHNYMRYGDPTNQPNSGAIIGDTSNSKAATTAQFAAFWGEMAKRYKDNPRVIFGLVNEPHDMTPQLVMKNNQAAITAIRNAGAKQLITAPGTGYTGGHSFVQGTSQGNEASAAYWATLNDPLKNTAVEIHEYLDSDFSGSHLECTKSYPTDLAPLTAWAKKGGFKVMLSEIGGSASSACATKLNEAITYLENNSDVYIGWAAWAAGPFWNVYSPCCNDGQQLGSLEPGSKAANGGPSMYDTVWKPVFAKRVPSGLLNDGKPSHF